MCTIGVKAFNLMLFFGVFSETYFFIFRPMFIPLSANMSCNLAMQWF